MTAFAARRASAERLLRVMGNALARLCRSCAAFVLFLVILLCFVNVVLRYVFFRSLGWAEELMLYLMIFAVYAGAVSVAWEQRHIRLDAIVGHAPFRWRRFLNVLTAVILIAVLVPVIYSSSSVVVLLYQMGERSDAMQTPIWIPQSVVPVSIALMALVAVVRIFVPDETDRDSSYVGD